MNRTPHPPAHEYTRIGFGLLVIILVGISIIGFILLSSDSVPTDTEEKLSDTTDNFSN